MPFDLDKVVNEYRENGYVSGLPILSKYDARKLRNYIVELEKKYGFLNERLKKLISEYQIE